ncbi:acyltransferase family protein [Marinibactrum halimedae]|uniref:Acyltransferase 3 domain-containing protein n=1 Tax=Marinibactrum halimedae TaxID=1444977 RepID=A0AA37WQF9_9GAMM|nr:acyltransferase [Marinibactrum halimedae]MCD9457591.1 acyltransferase [Marinibactrum halimedae]GLS28011.1 hypothetical protein GCM10007877_37300 [Marinibactrum halimedae]
MTKNEMIETPLTATTRKLTSLDNTAQEASYFPYFDYLRILLASVVMLHHDDVIGWHHSGALAVDVFFAMSGWLIGSILLETPRHKLPRFYFNRAIRIWIPYYLAVGAMIAASILKDPIDTKWFEFVIYKITWVYNIFGTPQLADCVQCMPLDGTGNHVWSVNAEEQFYLWAPIFLVILASFGRSPVTWVLFAGVSWYFEIYAPISLGVLAAILAKRYGDFYNNAKARLAFGIVIALCTLGFIFDDHFYWYSPLFSIAVVLFFAIHGKQHKYGALLGGMSYPLYLNHWIGVFVFNMVLDPFGLRDSPLRQLLASLLSLGIAAFLYWFIERKVLAMRSKIYTEKLGKFFTASAYLTVIAGTAYGVYMLNA